MLHHQNNICKLLIKSHILRLTILSVASFCFLFHCHPNKQNSKDKRKKFLEENRLKYSIEYKETVLDSIEFTGKLIDMNFGGTCGTTRSAGAFLFKIEKRAYGNCPDTLIVLIQCADRDLYRMLLFKELTYNVKVTPNKMKNWVDIIWEQYKDHQRYFCLEKSLTKIE